jgi:dual specificity phosphatase 12
MAKFPSTPTPSQPATPVGGMARRKIRCKMCRRQLATREHMMDHILDQTPMVPRSRTPSMSLTLPSPMTTMDGPPLESSTASSPPMNEGERKRRNSRLGSMSSMTSPSVSSPLGMSISTATMDEAFEEAVIEEPGQTRSNSNPTGRKVLDAEALAASLPPQLAALRAGVPGRPGTPPTAASNAARRISQPNTSSNGGISPSASVPIPRPSDSASNSSSANVSPRNSFSYGQSQGETDASTPSTRNQAAKRLSMMALTPSMNGNSALSRLSMDESAIASDGEQTGSPTERTPVRRRGSASSFTSMQREPAILSHDSKCSGYFVEPVSMACRFRYAGRRDAHLAPKSAPF